MRRAAPFVVGSSALPPRRSLGAGLHHAGAGQTRGTLQVSVQVTAPCAASLDATGQRRIDGGLREAERAVCRRGRERGAKPAADAA